MIARVACWVAFASLLACYSPTYLDCQIQCGASSSCPSGLTCDTSNMCRLPNPIGTCGGSGGSNADASMLDALTCPTWHGLFPPSNFDPCDDTFPAAAGALDLEMGGAFNTDNLTLTDTSTGQSTSIGAPYNGVWAIHVTTVLTANGIVTVTGSTPLLIVADDTMMIGTSIDASVASTAGDPSCAKLDGDADAGAGAGGGGGGFGSTGGSGGPEMDSNAISGGAEAGTTSLVPLRLGCPGGGGGTPGSLLGGAGGNSGGAFELAAGNSITIASGFTLFAGGGGGSPGMADAGASTGGGGGGAGGSVLLEAPTLVINASVCAPGGGGGQGANSTGPLPAAGQHGTCVGGPGGSVVSAGGFGGAGGTGSSGVAGLAGEIATDSGGGGGGSVGRIHFHAASQANLMLGSGAAFVPAPQ